MSNRNRAVEREVERLLIANTPTAEDRAVAEVIFYLGQATDALRTAKFAVATAQARFTAEFSEDEAADEFSDEVRDLGYKLQEYAGWKSRFEESMS